MKIKLTTRFFKISSVIIENNCKPYLNKNNKINSTNFFCNAIHHICNPTSKHILFWQFPTNNPKIKRACNPTHQFNHKRKKECYIKARGQEGHLVTLH